MHSSLCKCDVCLAEKNLAQILSWLSVNRPNNIIVSNYIGMGTTPIRVEEFNVSRNGNGFTVIDWRRNEGNQ